MTDVLTKILAQKQIDIAQARARRPLVELEAALPDAPPVRDFCEALTAADGMGLIAEVKQASPSAGLIRPEFNPEQIADLYASRGAHCLSVLTDETFFRGHLDYLTSIRQRVDPPLLRKDFLLDRYQVLEARVAGADCILLIAECLDDCRLRDLYFYASELGMESLIEIYEPDNLDRVLALEPSLLGVNNRNLRTFETDLQHSLDLVRQVPQDCLFVSESGIRTREDVLRLQAAGVRAMLIGATLMRADDIGGKIDELLGQE